MPKNTRDVYFVDDGVLVAGYIRERFLRRPVFYPYHTRCGFSSQVLTKKDKVLEHTRRARRKIYRETYPAGTRIRLITHHKRPMPVPTGSVCVVTGVDSSSVIHCVCDDVRVAVHPELDGFQLVRGE